jgi:hypothetical protein
MTRWWDSCLAQRSAIALLSYDYRRRARSVITAEAPPSLGAWTSTLRFEDVLEIVLLAKPGQSEQEWRTQAGSTSRFPVTSQRNKQLAIATAILRPQNGVITNDPFLDDLRHASRSRARDLITDATSPRFRWRAPLPEGWSSSTATRSIHSS